MIDLKRWLTLLAVLLIATAVVSAAERVRIAVVTASDPSGLVDKPTEERLKAVTDIKRRLAKNDTVQIVESAEGAQAVIEVTFIGTRDGGPTASTVIPVGGAAVITPPGKVTEFVGQATLTSGTFKTEFQASIGPLGRSYGENLARRVEDWLKKNIGALRAVR